MCWATGRAGQLGCGQTAGELSNSVTWRLAAAAAAGVGGGVMLNLALTSTTTAQEPGHGAVVLWCCGAGHHHTHSCVWCCLHCYRRSTVTTHLHLSSGTSSLIKLGLPASTNISTTQQCAHNLTMYNHGQKRSAPYKRSLQTINMLLDHEGCDTVL